MDYKYIEQLLERYWECQTTLEEEAILRNFFRQDDVPASLLPYRQLFAEQDALAEEHLSEDFAEKMLQLVGEDTAAQVCKARRLTIMRRLRPFYRAAAAIAILLTIGDAAQQSFTNDEAAEVQQMAESVAGDTLRGITTDQPEKQAAALATSTGDSLDAKTR